MNLAIVPVVCGVAQTKDCIDSLLAQDVPIAVFAIDNGSEGGCSSLLSSYGRRITRISYSPRRSLSQVWNEALRMAFESLKLEYAIVLNNDTVLRQDTVRLLVEDGGEFVTAVGTNTAVVYSSDWLLAEARVKLGHFTRQGLQPRGVVHVGANDGYEIEWYRKLGVERVIAFEPLAEAASKAQKRYASDSAVQIYGHALGGDAEIAALRVSEGDGQGSSFLAERSASYKISSLQPAEIARFDSLDLSLDGFDTLVVDVQGMELAVLKGFGSMLGSFKYLNIECSREPLYEGSAAAAEVIGFLKSHGFEQDSPVEAHNDIMFIRQGERLHDRRRPHPDFSCFLMRQRVWQRVGGFDERIGAYTGDCDFHLRMHQAGVEAYSLSVPFEHVASGTLKNASDKLRDALASEADADRKVFRELHGCEAGSEEYNSRFKRGC